MKEEIWKPVRGYENLYEVSSFGKIRSVDKVVYTNNRFNKMQKKIKGKILSPFLNKKTGYMQVALSKNKKTKLYLVHRLVALTFFPIDNISLQVNHIDGNKQNNNVENLEWCTRSENIVHAYKIGLAHSNFKTQSGTKHHFYGKHHKNSSKEKMRLSHYRKINQYDKDNNFIKTWDGIKLAENILKINNGNISGCCRGKRKTAGGYIWRYVNEERVA